MKMVNSGFWGLKSRTIFYLKQDNIGFFSIWNQHKCLSQLFLLHLNTCVMGLQASAIFYSFGEGTNSTRQILTSIDVRFCRLKGLAQDKIIKKSVILFRALNMTIWCKHRLELQFKKKNSAAHSSVIDIETKFPNFLFLTWLSIIRNQESRLYIQPNWCMRSTKIKQLLQF